MEWNSNGMEKLPNLLECFLDSESVHEKYKLLEEHYEEVDERMIGNIEASLDLVGKQGSVSERIDYVMYYLRTRQRFETDRLR